MQNIKREIEAISPNTNITKYLAWIVRLLILIFDRNIDIHIFRNIASLTISRYYFHNPLTYGLNRHYNVLRHVATKLPFFLSLSLGAFPENLSRNSRGGSATRVLRVICDNSPGNLYSERKITTGVERKRCEGMNLKDPSYLKSAWFFRRQKLHKLIKDGIFPGEGTVCLFYICIYVYMCVYI